MIRGFRRALRVAAWATAWLGIILVAATELSQAQAPPKSRQAPPPTHGYRYRLRSITGQTMVVPNGRSALLYFLSASCGSCWVGATRLAGIYPKVHQMAQVVLVDVTPEVDPPAAVERMARATGTRWPLAYATPALLAQLRVTALDTAAVLTPAGRVVYAGVLPSDRRIIALLKAAERRSIGPPSGSPPPGSSGLPPCC